MNKLFDHKGLWLFLVHMELAQFEDSSIDDLWDIEHNRLNQVYQRKSQMDTLNIGLDRRDCMYLVKQIKIESLIIW